MVERIINKKELRILGLSRSGNHAVINWILSQINGNYCFLNCTEPKYNPFLTARPLNKEGVVFKTNIEGFSIEKEQEGELAEKDYLIYNHEDCFLGSMNKKGQSTFRQEWVGSSADFQDILILRDPFNLFASRIKAGLLGGHYTHHGARPISLPTLRRIYKQHSREYIGLKNNLKNKVLINFDSWSSIKEYRKNIARQLDIPFSDKGFTEVPEVAGGSSFDGIKYAGQPHKMDLQNRWQKYASDEEFWEMFDEEIVELSKKIFGKLAAAKEWESRQIIEPDIRD